MAFAMPSGKGQPAPQMNVTPLVDVVLVLLIIFMVVTPLLTKQFWLQLPPDQKAETPPPPDPTNVVVKVEADGRVVVNSHDVGLEELTEKLRPMVAARYDRTVFFDAADDAPYKTTVDVMDRLRKSGATTIAVLAGK